MSGRGRGLITKTKYTGNTTVARRHQCPKVKKRQQAKNKDGIACPRNNKRRSLGETPVTLEYSPAWGEVDLLVAGKYKLD